MCLVGAYVMWIDYAKIRDQTKYFIIFVETIFIANLLRDDLHGAVVDIKSKIHVHAIRIVIRTPLHIPSKHAKSQTASDGGSSIHLDIHLT